MRANTDTSAELQTPLDVVLTLLGTAEQSAVVLQAEVNLDQLSAGEELHDHARGNDRGDTELHQGTAVGRENDTHPVQRV
jgi:hypothetical protein